MEPAATPFLVRQSRAPSKTAVWAILSLVTGGFLFGLYRARHSFDDLAFVVGDYCTTYYGLYLLYICLEKHELLRGDDGPAAATERRRVRHLPLWFAMFLGFSMVLRVALVGVVPNLAPNFGLWVLLVLAIGLGLYFLVAGRRSDARPWPEERV